MTEEIAVTAPCGCKNDDATGLLIAPCKQHSDPTVAADFHRLVSEYGGGSTWSCDNAAHDRLLAAALPAADRLKRAHNNNHAGLLVTCAMPACIELRALFSAIRECWPADQEQGEMP